MWALGLGFATAYLANHTYQLTGKVDAARAEANDAADPSTDGITTAEIRKAKKETTDENNEWNPSLGAGQIASLNAAAEVKRLDVKKYEGPALSMEPAYFDASGLRL